MNSEPICENPEFKKKKFQIQHMSYKYWKQAYQGKSETTLQEKFGVLLITVLKNIKVK